jgi:hypothetical protein
MEANMEAKRNIATREPSCRIDRFTQSVSAIAAPFGLLSISLKP